MRCVGVDYAGILQKTCCVFTYRVVLVVRVMLFLVRHTVASTLCFGFSLSGSGGGNPNLYIPNYDFHVVRPRHCFFVSMRRCVLALRTYSGENLAVAEWGLVST